ncbi:hypothetical protein HT102_11100 [Hoyosella sp. G463]|uniref:Anti-sigma-M factor RsmA n=1 Tax=Lolliginicoccus lacisalsi TaxID=2742202 RepID=A0A927PLE8_9ACTN|nr:hypothetical protein [Lolliginicoccus lacisalsi]MBD8507035.1 hypothetical protein [Lolliginicoccus lacisalsi]
MPPRTQREPALPEPPYDRQLLSELHAGTLPGATAAHIRDRLHLDSAAGAFLGELDEVQRRLARLSAEHPGNQGRGDDLPVHLTEQLDAMLAGAARERAEAAWDTRRARRRGSHRYVVAAVACAAALAGLLVLSPRLVDLVGASSDASLPPGSATQPWGFEAGRSDEGAGPLDPQRLQECLDAAGMPGGTEIIGVEPMRTEDLPRARFRVIVAAPSGPGMLVLTIGNGCGPGEAGILDRRAIGAPGE